jgi:hypothetical protein
MSGRNGDRLTAVAYLEFDDHADELLQARATPQMKAAAQSLRLAALDVRRRLYGSPPEGTTIQLDSSVPNPEQRRVELANLAVDVVAATDYLLGLLDAPAGIAPRLLLTGEAEPARGNGALGDRALDRLTRQRLDARTTAVRLAMRLRAELRGDIAKY